MKLSQSLLQPLKALWHRQWTGLLGCTKIIAGGGLYIGHVLSNQDVKTALDNMHLSPQICLGLAVLGALVLLSEEH